MAPTSTTDANDRDALTKLRRQVRTKLWSKLTTRFPRRELRRIGGMLDIWTGEKAPSLQEHQRIALLFLPDLPSSGWLDPQLFPFFTAVRDSYPRVRREVRTLIRKRREPDGLRRAYMDPTGGDVTTKPPWVRPGWVVHPATLTHEFPLRKEHCRVRDNCLSCPETARIGTLALRKAIFQPEYNVFMMPPGCYMAPHVDGVNFLVSFQMGLLVPDDCGLEVAKQYRPHQEGQVLCFDNSFVHAAWNRGKTDRYILSMYTAHPDLTRTELRALRFLFPVIYSLV